jgi:hypothetical protein
MAGIEGISPLAPVGALSLAAQSMRVQSGGARPNDALQAAASPLRVRLAEPHERSVQLHRTMSIIDSADAALERTHSLLIGAREAAGREGVRLEDDPLDAWLMRIEETTTQPIAGSGPLNQGSRLVAGDWDLDVRPLNTSELGAVVWSGRSHRLSDAGAGGPLDHRINPTGALKSIDAAMTEVSGVRASLREFRAQAVVPAQRDSVAAVRAITDTGPSSVNEVAPIAAGLRATMFDGGSWARLAAHDPARVLSLLG